jgi:iron-sulfur cluster assembly protein
MNNTPSLKISKIALAQLKIMQEMDYTLEGKYPRIAVKGKGCSGFDYALFFDTPKKNDVVVTFEKTNILLDPFTAFYFKNGTIDYKLLPGEEGFIITNFDEELYQGKFYDKNPQLVPTLY